MFIKKRKAKPIFMLLEGPVISEGTNKSINLTLWPPRLCKEKIRYAQTPL